MNWEQSWIGDSLVDERASEPIIVDDIDHFIVDYSPCCIFDKFVVLAITKLGVDTGFCDLNTRFDTKAYLWGNCVLMAME